MLPRRALAAQSRRERYPRSATHNCVWVRFERGARLLGAPGRAARAVWIIGRVRTFLIDRALGPSPLEVPPFAGIIPYVFAPSPPRLTPANGLAEPRDSVQHPTRRISARPMPRRAG
eukprot:365969-Chlamydomonas_euryale.AAC.13